ncbi:hypothetical protein Cni_G15703 [Canna indica]|uniref:Uncharacterized protein n=1 Tax=Canna indica TaxID=4628 RepID=A0AAQ3KHH5_9LILI|nr:hypothetical protein Cni_G15703 [Canna indica]
MLKRSKRRTEDVDEKPAAFLAATDCNEMHEGREFSSHLLQSARLTTARLLRLLGAKTSKALHFLSRNRRLPPSTQQELAPPADSHLSEAIEDCIKFLHSSSRRSC